MQRHEQRRPLNRQRGDRRLSYTSNFTTHLKMSQYLDLTLQDSMKEQLFRCKLHLLERRCCGQVEKLKALIGEHLQSGTSVSYLLEKTMSFLTLRKTLLSHSGYSKYSRDILRLFPDAEEDVALLCV